MTNARIRRFASAGICSLTLLSGMTLGTQVAFADEAPMDESIAECLLDTGSNDSSMEMTSDGLLIVGDQTALAIDAATGTDTAFNGPKEVLALEGATAGKVALAPGDEWGAWRERISTGPTRILVSFGADKVISSQDVEVITALAGPSRRVYWWGPAHEVTAANAPTIISAALKHPNLTYIPAAAFLPGRTLMKSNRTELMPEDSVKRAWRYTVDLARAQYAPAVATTDACVAALRELDGGDSMRQAALDFALMVVSDPLSKYSFSTVTSPSVYPFPYNCSTLIAASYRYATNDEMMLTGFSDSLLWDVANVELVPWEEAKPGDIMFQKTMDDRFLGHVGMIFEKGENGGGTIIHACGSDGWCANAPADGMGFTPIANIASSGRLITVTNPALVDSARSSAVAFTTDYTQAWYGRVRTVD